MNGNYGNDDFSGKTTSSAQGFVPSVGLGGVADTSADGSISLDATNPDNPIPTVVQEQQNKTVSLFPETEAPTEKRVVADISEMAKPVDPNAPIPGVDQRKSPADDILQPGGIFDQYVEGKKKEFVERMAQEDMKAADEQNAIADQLAAEAAGESVTVDPEEQEILKEQPNLSPNMANVKVATVSRDETHVSEEPKTEESVASTESKSEVPFWQAAKEAGWKDEYPEEYDLPSDEEMESIMKDNENNKTETVQKDTGVSTSNTTEPERHLESKVVKMPEHHVDDKDESDNNGVFETERTISNKSVNYKVNTEDFDKDKDETNDDIPSDEARLEEFRSEVTERLKEKEKALNLEGFTFADKATASNMIFDTSEVSAGKWVLPATGICIEMRSLAGQEVENLRLNINSPSTTLVRNRLRILYDHVITPKPAAFEVWLKSTSYADYDHLFMPAYLAAFANANYMPGTCIRDEKKIAKVDTGCGKMFLSSHIDIMNCVKFTSEETKKKFWDLYDSNATNGEGLYVSELIPISRKFAIRFRDPSIYAVMFEMASFNNEFAQKYMSTINIMPYIDDIFFLDWANKKFVKVEYKHDPNNLSKDSKAKVIKYDNVMNSFSTDEYSRILNIISAINDRSDWMTYQVPEMTCPECGRKIEAQESTASSLVFTRHRLGLLANTSIK